jgi:hypothetical protein
MPTFETEKSGMTMAKIWIGVFTCAVLLISCSKNNDGNAPHLVLNSVSSNNIPYNTDNSLVTFTFTLTEKSYNQNDSMYVLIQVPNCTGDSANLSFPMTSLASGIPTTNTGSGFKGTLEAAFSNGQYFQTQGYPDIESDTTCYVGPVIQNDTCYFSFTIGTIGHYSDTIKTGPIVLIHG